MRFDGAGDAAGYAIYVGGDGKDDCVDVTVFAKDPVGLLGFVKYDAGCAAGQPFGRGHMTGLLRATLSFVARRFPWVRRLRLNDFSTVRCGDVTLRLPYAHIAATGATWYESVLGARIEDPGLHAAYRASVAALGDAAPKAAHTYDAFCDRYQADPESAVVRRCYDAASSFRDFMDRVRAAYGADREALCKATWPWQELLLTDVVAFHPKWVVDLDAFAAAAVVGGALTVRRDRGRRVRGGAGTLRDTPTLVSMLSWEDVAV